MFYIVMKMFSQIAALGRCAIHTFDTFSPDGFIIKLID